MLQAMAGDSAGLLLANLRLVTDKQAVVWYDQYDSSVCVKSAKGMQDGIEKSMHVILFLNYVQASSKRNDKQRKNLPT